MTTVEVVRGFAAANVHPDAFATHTRQVTAALLDLEMAGCGLSDSVVRPDLAGRRLDIEVVVDGDTVDDATGTADWCIQTAMYAADGAGADWRPEIPAQTRPEDGPTGNRNPSGKD